ncbi:hypothetical protein V1514DRAFT_339171 [Lipomyces japonicus]|uniref:uncharacterized protein n=1 Tax=Lipomyces japonicus TaxID=56871 RepID=UPI0034CDCF00
MAKSGVAFSPLSSVPNSVYRVSALALITYAIIHLISSLIFPSPLSISNSEAQAKAKVALQKKIETANVGQDGFKITARDYFEDFYGAQECQVSSSRLYNPHVDADGNLIRKYCANKDALLGALSSGGRIGFNTPFHPLDCEYRWFQPEEICLILDRFDAIVFIGEQRMTSHVYAAFNSILRKNLAWGGLKNWELSEQLRQRCRCESQYINPQCAGGAAGTGDHYIADSTEILDAKEDGTKTGAPYVCNRVFHGIVNIKNEPVPQGVLDDIDDIMTTYHKTSKPVPVIFQAGLAHGFNWDRTTKVMDAVLKQLDKHEPNPRHRPVLWLGPTAAGHLKPPGAIIEQGNNALHHFSVELGKRANDRGFDVLNLYNFTLQSDSYDGTMYGQDVSLTTAMMIFNWLSRVDSL